MSALKENAEGFKEFNDNETAEEADSVSLFYKDLALRQDMDADEEKELVQVMIAGREAAKKRDETRTLTQEEDKELLLKIRKGERARERLIEANLSLVTGLARKLHRASPDNISLADLIQEGSIGLITSLERFDPKFGTRVSTFAYYDIKSNILRFINKEKEGIIAIPKYIESKSSKIEKESIEYEAETGLKPTDEELAKRTDFSVKEIQKTRSAKKNYVNFDSSPGDMYDTDSYTLAERMDIEGGYVNQEEVFEQESLRNALKKAMKDLPLRSYFVLSLRFGLEDGVPCSLREIGEELNLTRQSILNIEHTALKTLNETSRNTLFYYLPNDIIQKLENELD